MIIVIVYKEEEKGTEIVSHGHDLDTDKIVILPQLTPFQIGARYDLEIGEYVLDGDNNDR
jgi:cell wall assembly regulator SMI1